MWGIDWCMDVDYNYHDKPAQRILHKAKIRNQGRFPPSNPLGDHSRLLGRDYVRNIPILVEHQSFNKWNQVSWRVCMGVIIALSL